ncbi:HlyD family secretion protein [Henriciella aquimarina]|uniref:HlyD family secretion protein n=1 Tax=Henriciella aquimarina TaxID=545261 RepID=UPI000A05AAF3|nr:HlyD family secretion protein [Henriciella aquimarina]
MDGSSAGPIEEASADTALAPQPERKKPKWYRGPRFILMVVPPVLVALGVAAYLISVRGHVSTDNAVVAAARAPISASIGGRVTDVLVEQNHQVEAGDVLFRLDDSDYRTAVASAEARLASARLRVSALRASYRQAMADLSTARSRADYAGSELKRQKNLVEAGVSSQQKLDEAQNAADVARRAETAALEARANALANLGGSADVETDRHPLVLEAQAALEQARSDLEDTVIVAPSSGTVARVDQIQPGAYVQPAQTLFWLISGNPWVDAAFKENQLEHLKPGQPAEIRVDAYPDIVFEGHVVSFSPGTGSSFSVLPAENATGNWVHVVQRLNVRIEFDEPPATDLAVGLSAEVDVNTRPEGPSGS